MEINISELNALTTEADRLYRNIEDEDAYEDVQVFMDDTKELLDKMVDFLEGLGGKVEGMRYDGEKDKSTVDEIEFTVVTRPFYREHKPSYLTVIASDEKEAVSMVWNVSNDIKEILDVKLSTEFVWDEDTTNHYWDMYR